MIAVIIEGRLTRDIEVRTLKNDKGESKTANMSVASTLKLGTKDQTTFLDVELWNSNAENCAKYLKKGSRVLVRGDLTSREYEKDGQKKTVYYVTNADVTFLETKPKEEKESA